jgi:IS30 family transposase
VTLADRVSKKTLIAHAPSKHAEVVTDAIIQLLLPEKEQLHTITVIAKTNKINLT